MLPKQATGSYLYNSDEFGGFYSLDSLGWMTPAVDRESSPNSHNCAFTTELRYYLQYRGGEVLDFSGDDDVWLFVNHRLALGLGGLQSPKSGTLTMNTMAATLGITVGKLHEVTLFHAERHSTGSNFKLTPTGFTPSHSVCTAICGDGIRQVPEVCDAGAANEAPPGTT